MELLQTIIVLIVTLAVLVTIHEFGHFWVARRCGIKVLRFSVGFGKPLYRWYDKTGTEFVIAALPLGGYVKMLDEREGNVPKDQLEFTFNRKPVGQRLATVAAGPLANFLLAIVIYWGIFASGVTGVVPIIGSVEQGSVAEAAGLEVGQEIVAVDGESTPTWQALHLRLLERIGETGEIHFSVKYTDSDVVYQSSAQLDRWLAGTEATDLVGGIGLGLFRPPVLAIVDRVVSGGPADQAGLKRGDHIVSADANSIEQWSQWVDHVRAHPGQAIVLGVERDNQQLSVTITPDTKYDENNQAYGQVGVGVMLPEWPEHMIRSFSYGVVGAMGEAVKRTGQMSLFTLESIKKMLLGLISPKNLSGPITIAKVATASANSGLETYLGFLALLSVSLGVLNLLPIPVLDGGHILYGLMELLTGRQVSERVQVVGYQLGAVIIAGVMVFALYNDIMRL